MSFVHLHCHTEGSLLDGMCRVKDMARVAAEVGMPAIACTDHGVMYNVIDFYQACVDNNVKPIVGCELYVHPVSRTVRDARSGNNYYHMLALAKDESGYKNLVKLVSKGFLEGFYYKPRVDPELLSEHAAGLVTTSSCLGGELPQLLMKSEFAQAEKRAEMYREIFGPENFYLELQDHGLAEQPQVNEELARIAERTGIPLVCTNDVHYLRQQDADPHELLLCIQTGHTINSPKRLRYGPPAFYLKSPYEMRERFARWPEALENTLRIAALCDLQFDFTKTHLPHYEVPAGYTAETYLEKMCRDGIQWRYGQTNEQIEQRLAYELDIIQTKGYSTYFLIVEDFVRFARSQGIMSQARGSAAGSLVSYLLGLTVIDPLKYGLLFERFLTRERKSMPDIDLDFADDRREEVIQYCRDKYGADHVAQIIAFGTMAAKAAVRDAGRALEYPIPEVDRVAKLIPTTPGMTIEKALKENQELANVYQADPNARKLVDSAKSVEGLYRNASTHAAGVVITKEPVWEYAPVQKVGDAGLTIQFEWTIAEKIGLLKMDFLGLRNLTVVDRCVKLIKKTRGIDLDLSQVPIDDDATYKLLQAGEGVGVFQLESGGMQKLLRQLRPDRLEDIIDLVALYRPGPLGSGMTEEFCRRRHGQSAVSYLHPLLEPLLNKTNGIILYQEQVMQIAMKLADFSAGQAEDLMKAMSKKIMAKMEKLQPVFIAGAEKNGVPKKTAQDIFDQMLAFAAYGFGLNHSAAYAVLSYHTAYLKANYFAEFMAVNMSSIVDNKDRLALYIADTRRARVEVLPPDINLSEGEFTVETRDEGRGMRDEASGAEAAVYQLSTLNSQHAVRFGLAAIKNVSGNAVECILKARASGPFESFADFITRVCGCEEAAGAITKTAVECLIKAGALDSLERHRAALLAGLESALGAASALRRSRAQGQSIMFDGDDDEGALPRIELPVTPWLTKKEALAAEKELLGVYVSDHPLNEHAANLRRHATHSVAELEEAEDRQDVTLAGILAAVDQRTTKAGKPMARVTLEDLTGSVTVMLFPACFEQYGSLLAKDGIVILKGKTSVRDRGEGEGSAQVEVICEEVTPFHASSSASTAHVPATANGNGHARATNGSGHPGANGNGQATNVRENGRAYAPNGPSRITESPNHLGARRPDDPTTHAPAVHIRLSEEILRDNRLRVLRGLVDANPGDCRLIFHVPTAASPEEKVVAKRKVARVDRFLNEVRTILGPDAIWVG